LQIASYQEGGIAMNITVLNGSPKGPTSATMQYVHYIQKKFPEHELQIISIFQRIAKIEDDAQAFQNILDGISSSDAILWASPVYFAMKNLVLWARSEAYGSAEIN
jgi:NAD(P)H-dependent FMN reductase